MPHNLPGSLPPTDYPSYLTKRYSISGPSPLRLRGVRGVCCGSVAGLSRARAGSVEPVGSVVHGPVWP